MTPNPTPSRKPRVVIVGGGFAGIHAAKKLRRAPVSIVLIDQRNYHLFQPLLYQVATAELQPSNIAAPIRRIFRRQKNIKIALGQVAAVDLKNKSIEFFSGHVKYDYLILAMGVQQSYFGHDEFRPHAPGLKSIDDATEIRRRLLLAFEEAEWEADLESRRAKLTFVVVGGGPTGVELAGAIADVASRTLPRDFRNIDTRMARILLVEGSDRLVHAMPEQLGNKAQAVLEKVGVEIRLNTHVTHVDDQGVMIGDEQIPAENVFWAAGVQGQPLAKTLGVPLDRAGRVIVQKDLSIAGHPEAFVVGDAALAIDAKTGQPVPGVAQGAIQTGKFVADIISREVQGRAAERPPFGYLDKGSMAIIGRGNAVAAIGKTHLGGFFGWITWGLVHVMFLVGFGNRLLVMTEWFWNYLRNTRRSRLITGDPDVHIKRLRGAALTDSTLDQDP